MIGWWRLERELARWARAGRRPRLWWRDDDAETAGPALHRLLALAGRLRLPLLLAVIPGRAPAAELAGLAACLAAHPQAFVAQHGVCHANHRRPGEPDAEHPSWQPAAAIAAAIAGARPRLSGMPRLLPVYVPPWNAAHPALRQALAGLGLALSAGGAAGPGGAPAELDPLRWRPQPRFRGAGACLGRMRRALRQRRRAGEWDRPLGLLTHHLAHDAACWAFLEAALPRLAADPRLDWIAPPALFPPLDHPGSDAYPSPPMAAAIPRDLSGQLAAR